MKNQSKYLLLVGSIPPPYHGQAVVTEMVFGIEAEALQKECLNLRFSEDIESIGGIQLSKVKILIYGWLAMFGYWLKNIGKKPVLYYCAGSAHWVPLIRDVILLGTVGKLFSRRVVHYHSGGVPEWFAENKVASLLGRWTYGGAEKSIALTEAVAVPCYGNTEKCVVPNGLDVEYIESESENDSTKSGEVVFLFLGALRDTKGIGVLIEAARMLNEQHAEEEWVVHCVGEWASAEEREKWLIYIESHGLQDRVRFLGRLTGSDKWQAYAEASIFVFPSYYESENQPLVIIEAMGMGIPVISTRWRGIPELLEEGETGLLVPPQDVKALSNAMAAMMNDTIVLEQMAHAARERYLENFTKVAFQNRIVFCMLNRYLKSKNIERDPVS